MQQAQAGPRKQCDDKALRARVFISCGQNKRNDERAIANEIAEKLDALGFGPYVAVGEQSLRGLKENIFEHLRNSEYFIFVDFKREALMDKGSEVHHRGSLFTNQELAIASFLDMPVLAFQEEGVKPNDGILGFLQTNPIPFNDRPQLPEMIAEAVQAHPWSPTWRNELELVRDPRQSIDVPQFDQYGQPPGPEYFMKRFFHIGVENHHRDMTARNCYVFLKHAVRLDSSVQIPMKAVEFKWAGYTQPNANIPAKTDRRFDACSLFHSTPLCLRFDTFTDSPEFVNRIEGEGRYELHYEVVSDNFPPARASFILDLNKSLDQTSLIAKSEQG